MKNSSIVVIGNANIDLTTYVPRAPEAGETVLGTHFSTGMGGKGANQAVAAARAGSDVALIARVGQDSFGEMMTRALTAEGLDLTQLTEVEGPSGVATIWVDSLGENRIAVFPGASSSLTAKDAQSSVATHTSAHILLSQLEIDQDVVAAALQAGISQGMTTILNIAPYAPLRPGILDNTTWLVANEGEMGALLVDRGIESHADLSAIPLHHNMPRWSQELGCNLLITRGPDGAAGCSLDGEIFDYAAPLVKALDTVGAGDCFVGFFAAFLDHGLTWHHALKGAVLAASDTVARPGAQSSYPSAGDAKKYRTLASAS
jgi:ribokinase